MPPNWALAANPPCQFLRVLESKLKKKKKKPGLLGPDLGSRHTLFWLGGQPKGRQS